jgi:hypothetical protein
MIRARKNSTAVVISPTVTTATRGRKKVLPDSLPTVTTATRGRKKVLPDSLGTVTVATRGRKKVEPTVTTSTRGRKKVEPTVTTATRGRKKVEPTVTVATRGRKKVEPTVTTATRGRKKVEPVVTVATRGRKKVEPVVTVATRGRKKVEPTVTVATRGRKKVEPAVTVATRGRKKVEPAVTAATRGRKKVEFTVTLANGGFKPPGQSSSVVSVVGNNDTTSTDTMLSERKAAAALATAQRLAEEEAAERKAAAALATAQRLAEEEAAERKAAAALATAQILAEEEAERKAAETISATTAAEISAEADQELLNGVLNVTTITQAGETNYKNIKAQIKSLKVAETNFVLSIKNDYTVSSSTKNDETQISQEGLILTTLTPDKIPNNYKKEIEDIKKIGEDRRNKIEAREKEIEAREKKPQNDKELPGLEKILEDDEFNSLLDDLTKIHDLTEIHSLTKIQGGKKGRGRVIKAKYGKKYRGGNVRETLNRLKDKVKEGIFGATIQISQEDSELIEEAAKYFKENMEGIAEDDVHERNLDTQTKTNLLLLFGRLLKSERGIDRVVKSFRAKKIVEIASANNALLTTYKKKVTGRSDTLKSIEYVDGDIFNKLYRPHKSFYIYGMQLPHQFDRIRLLGTIYKLNSAKIYSIVDLHDCNIGGNGVHPLLEYGVGCNPYDRDCELDMWSLAISTAENTNLPNNAKYYGIEYQDMTSGNLSTWNAISCISNTRDIKNQIVIHCLAGAGRTGSVMLYLLMRDFYILYEDKKTYTDYLKDAIAKRYFGYATIREFIDKILYTYFTIEDDDNLNYNRLYIKCMMSELFEIEGTLSSGKTRVSLFRQRLNYIIFFLARHFNIATFVIYHNPVTTKEGYQSKITGKFIDSEQQSTATYLDNEFGKSYEKTVNWTETEYDIDYLLRNIDSDDYKEVMSWIL